MGLIHIDYDDTIRKAQKIKGKAETIMSDCNGKMTSYQQSLSGAWKGDSSKEFVKKYNKNKKQLSNSAKTIRNTAQSLENLAKTLKKVDEYTPW